MSSTVANIPMFPPAFAMAATGSDLPAAPPPMATSSAGEAGGATGATKPPPQNRAFAFYDYDGTCGPDTSTSFLLYLLNHRPLDLFRLARPTHLWDVVRALYKYNIKNSFSMEEGVELLRKISEGFNMQLYSKEWAAKKGSYETYEFIIDEWRTDLKAGRDVVVISSQSELGLANLMRAIGFEKIEIVGGEQTGASRVFSQVTAGPEDRSSKRISKAPTAYILGTKFQMDEEGRIGGQLERWTHGEKKVTAINELKSVLEQRGIIIDWKNSRAYFDKRYDLEWAQKVPSENRTIMNPKGKGAAKFAADAFTGGSRVVNVIEEPGERPNERVIKTLVRTKEPSPSGGTMDSVREIRQLHEGKLTATQRFAGLAVSPFQFLWGDIASQWLIKKEVSLDSLKHSAEAFAMMTAVGSSTEMTVRGIFNSATRLPFFYAGPEIRAKFPAHFLGMFTGILVHNAAQTGQWDWESALKGAVIALGTHALLMAVIRGVCMFVFPKALAVPMALGLEMFVIPPLEFYLMKQWETIEGRE